jgi:predicted TIM-barrel fold metal-dependent hydrolase
METFGTWPQFIDASRREEVVRTQLSYLNPRVANDAFNDVAASGSSISESDPEKIRDNVLGQGFNEGADQESALKVAREGGWIGAKRLADLDADTIDIAVLYPTALLGWIEDTDLFELSCRGYNDWLHDFCRADPARLIGVGVVPVQDLERARAEMRRCVQELGFRAIMIRPAPYIGRAKLYNPIYDPFWKEACDLGVGIGVHPLPFADMPNVCRGLDLDEGMRFPTDNIFLRQGLTNALDIMVALAWFVGGGICERFPDLQVAFLEGSGGWLPSMLERLEHHFHIFGSPHQKSSPTEMFKRQCYISFDPDEYGLPFTAQYVGADRILWASDYPHPDAKIPGTVAELYEAIEPLAEHEQELIIGANAARFYRL